MTEPMKEALEIILLLTGAIFSGAVLVGGVTLAVCALPVGGCVYWWRWRRARSVKGRKASQD